MVDFPIETQEQLDAIVAKRVKDEKQLRQRVGELETQLEATSDQHQAALDEARAEADAVRGQWYQQKVEQAIEQRLIQAGHTDRGRNMRILKHVDYDAIEPDRSVEAAVEPGGVPHTATVLRALRDVEQDLPELFAEGRSFSGVGRAPDASRGRSDKPVFGGPLTRERVENMTDEEQRQPGMREKIDRFLQGERG